MLSSCCLLISETLSVDIPSLQDEMEDFVVYARAYLSIDYRKVW